MPAVVGWPSPSSVRVARGVSEGRLPSPVPVLSATAWKVAMISPGSPLASSNMAVTWVSVYPSSCLPDLNPMAHFR